MIMQTLLGVELPIIQAPMAGVQGSELAIAVYNAGGLGSLPCARNWLSSACAQRGPSTSTSSATHCSGQVISDSLIDFFDVDSRSKALGDMLPSFECSRMLL